MQLPKLPPWARFVLAGVVVACFAYAVTLMDRLGSVPETQVYELPPQTVIVPELDQEILAQVRDGTRRERLEVEKEPLRHLLAEAIDVGPSVATALGMPAEMVPIEALRRDITAWRQHWLWYEGRLVHLFGPRDGHPIDGYKIFEATIELADGEHVMLTFSKDPTGEFAVGDWVRIEGYLLMLRDTTFPETYSSMPQLVGRELKPDYPDWPAVTELDQQLLAGIDDSSVWPGDPAWNWIEADQGEVLWHLGAFVRDTADQRSFAEWRKIPALSVGDEYDRLIAGDVARGEPMRVFGTLIRRRTILAPPNPANITHWTTAWLQSSNFGGHLVPIWIPGKARDLPRRAELEIRGHYYRWYVYDTEGGRRVRTPLFLAADLHPFDIGTSTTNAITLSLAGLSIALLALLVWSQRRAARRALAHSHEMDARRRRRRQQLPTSEPATESATDSPTTG